MVIQVVLIKLIFLLSSLWAGSENEPASLRVQVMEGTGLIIKGSTSISTFECESGYFPTEDTLLITYERDSGKYRIRHGRLIFRIRDIQCGDPYSNRQMSNTLKVKKYPFIIADLLEIHPGSGPWYHKSVTARIELAGNEIIQEIPLRVSSLKDGNLELKGEQSFRMSTFGLEPPKPMMGLIRVEDKLDIGFSLWVKLVQTEN